ncbi:MAG: type II toxin-antitoxin system VapC family toxin [Solirubrobacterales bacterium]
MSDSPAAPSPSGASPRRARGLLDTSVVIDLERLAPGDLPETLAVSSITMAELTAGPHATSDPHERARRQERLQRAEATFDPLPFDVAAARAYGRIYAAAVSTGRKARGQRAVDLLIAAIALAGGFALYTRNPDDFTPLAGVLDVVAVGLPAAA